MVTVEYTITQQEALRQLIRHYQSPGCGHEIITRREEEWAGCNDAELERRFIAGMQYMQKGILKKWNHLNAHPHFNQLRHRFWDEVRSRGILHPKEPWTFETLYDFIWEIRRQFIAAGIKGLAPMTRHDITLFLGARWHLRPQDVYFHRGPDQGARILGIIQPRHPRLRISFEEVCRICPPLLELGEAFFVEYFLCHYHKEYKEIMERLNNE